ncbi:MAG: Glycosyl transferase family 2 [Puniceicoccaceae bacterium 5H]|nr:MAG: Glycosyl transferase family 2 [Puniceicoccaceae bacterium 5H]
MKARVAIVTRTRDRLPLLRRCLASVLGQTFTDWRHVIVNDGGDPAALEAFLQPWRERYADRLQVLHHEHSQGMQQAANAALEASESAFVAIHDDDDAWHPDFLRDTVAYLEAKGADSPYQGVVVQTERVWEDLDEDGQATEISREPYQPLKEVNLFRVGYENPFPPIAFLYRRAVLSETGPYRPEFDVAGDLDFNLRFLLHYEIGVLPDVRAYYHWRRTAPDGLSNSVTAGQAHHAQKLNELKNHYLRSGRTPAEAALGLALEIAQYTLVQQWETRQILQQVEQLPERADFHAKIEDLRHAIREEDHQSTARTRDFLAKEIADKAESQGYAVSQQLGEKLEGLRQEVLTEFSRKAEDLRHHIQHEDQDAVSRMRDFLAKEIADKAEANAYHQRVEIEKLEATQRAIVEEMRQELNARKVLLKLGPLEIAWQKRQPRP